MQNRDAHAPLGSKDSAELGDSGRQISEMSQRQAADDCVKALLICRDGLQVGFEEGALGNVLPGSAQHLGRNVNPDHCVATINKVSGMATCPARGVEAGASSNGVKQGPNGRLLHCDNRISGFVVVI